MLTCSRWQSGAAAAAVVRGRADSHCAAIAPACGKPQRHCLGVHGSTTGPGTTGRADAPAAASDAPGAGGGAGAHHRDHRCGRPDRGNWAAEGAAAAEEMSCCPSGRSSGSPRDYTVTWRGMAHSDRARGCAQTAADAVADADAAADAAET